MMPKIQKREEAQFLGILLLDNKRVLHDTIDGEVLAVCSDTGTYYSLRGIAAEIWSLLAKEFDQENIIRQLQQRYADPECRIGSDTTKFIEQLLSEGLLTRPEAVDPGFNCKAESWTEQENANGITTHHDTEVSTDLIKNTDPVDAKDLSPQDQPPADIYQGATSLRCEQSGDEWTEPQLEIYSDMQDLLLFDPIHEVDPTSGWPSIPDHAG
jgi:hypothetical protein